MVWRVASRRKPYSLSALRNSASFCVKARMMRSTSAGAPERLTTDGAPAAPAAGVFCACAEAEAEPIVAAARTDKRTLFINIFPKLKGRREAFRVRGKKPAEQPLRCGPRVQSCRFEVQSRVPVSLTLNLEP